MHTQFMFHKESHIQLFMHTYMYVFKTISTKFIALDPFSKNAMGKVNGNLTLCPR